MRRKVEFSSVQIVILSEAKDLMRRKSASIDPSVRVDDDKNL
jgi:hypothetical protein